MNMHAENLYHISSGTHSSKNSKRYESMHSTRDNKMHAPQAPSIDREPMKEVSWGYVAADSFESTRRDDREPRW